MKILLISLNFWPEQTGIGKFNGELVDFLSNCSDEVTVITAPPYYPLWLVTPPYNSLRYQIERYGAARIWRCPIYVPKHPNGLRRVLHLLSFGLSCFPIALLEALIRRPDAVLVTEPPLSAAPAAIAASLLAGATSVIHIQDLEIDAAFQLGVINNRKILYWCLKLEYLLLRCFSVISTISPAMLRKICEKGVRPEKTLLVPNWVDLAKIYPLSIAQNNFRQELGYTPSQIVVLYSGTMGRKQGLETLAEAARKLVDQPHIQFLFCGAGPAKAKLRADTENLPNVRLLPLQPLEQLNQLLNTADIHLLPQAADAADLVLPSKLGGILASGRPVITAAHPNTHLHAISDGCGLCIPPEDSDVLAQAIMTLASDDQLRASCGALARRRAENDWNRDVILNNWRDKLLNDIKSNQGKNRSPC